jgi:hypothetical protein
LNEKADFPDPDPGIMHPRPLRFFSIKCESSTFYSRRKKPLLINALFLTPAGLYGTGAVPYRYFFKIIMILVRTVALKATDLNLKKKIEGKDGCSKNYASAAMFDFFKVFFLM